MCNLQFYGGVNYVRLRCRLWLGPMGFAFFALKCYISLTNLDDFWHDYMVDPYRFFMNRVF